MNRSDTDWESVARNVRQNLEQAQLEREEMRKFLKWMLDNDRVPKGLKALIAEALQGHY
ncbi:MAG TPA: hypothetical protein VIR01_15400 [Pyrinomonadaceae bacterium]|jgi:hypothetical protein